MEKNLNLNFEWDQEKNLKNQRKHGISFETAAYVFKDPNHIEIYDIDHADREDRFVAIGVVGKVLFVVFTERGEKIRLISARYATDSERSLYYDRDIYY